MNSVIPVTTGWSLTCLNLKEHPADLANQKSKEATSKPPITFDKATAVPFQIPGDVHSALLAAGVIDEPYFRDNEYAVDWVNKCAWQLQCTVSVDSQFLSGHPVLVLEGVDCVASVYINDIAVGALDNQFVRHVLPADGALVAGENIIRITFDVAADVAATRRADHPFEIPGESTNSRIPNNNFLRKTPCHSGWDWNICLMPSGVYGSIHLQSPRRCRIDDVRVIQEFNSDDVTLSVNVQIDVYEVCHVPCTVSIDGAYQEIVCQLYPGRQRVDIALQLHKPDLWWPSGMGSQSLHDLTLTLDGERWTQRVGFCQTQIVCQPDDVGPGRGFRINVNKTDVFMRGANWIPPDALPERGTPEVVRELLNSAVDANMNMLRVWGGGQYEPDWFYELCDELGILVWHDFMFSCNHYPATDIHWLESVRLEATQQVRRLSRFASLALWCGDNELVGALKWWEITQDNRDRYLANYVRLNTVLEQVVTQEVPNTPWWPSSPSQGQLDYADGWKSDVAGDMHFWDVWHEAKPFSSYQDIRPRFCSEFGFQSFPSMPVVGSFAEKDDQNVSSRVMGVHQRNIGGNARIVETLVRYFAFPDTFARTVFLSQCQQAVAIRTAVEYWRSLKPHCMGTLYWQLNDTWPVASWSSLEYGGGWKLLHYAARRFYQDVMMMIVPVERPERGARDFMGAVPGQDAQLLLRAVNDTARPVTLHFEVQAIDMHGSVTKRWDGVVRITSNAAEDVLPMAGRDIPDGCFLSFNWHSETQGAEQQTLPGREKAAAQGHVVTGEGEYWTQPYKNFDLPVPSISVVEAPGSAGKTITLQSDSPAFFVSVELGGRRVWSDNGFTLLPGHPKTISVVRELLHPAVPDVESHSIEHL